MGRKVSTTIIKPRHLRMLQELFICGEMTAKEMIFLSVSNVYTAVNELVDMDYVSIRMKRNPNNLNRKWIRSYSLTEKGDDYIKNKRWRLF